MCRGGGWAGRGSGGRSRLWLVWPGPYLTGGRGHTVRRPTDPGGAGVDVLIDFDSSASSTIIEVHAPDQVGLLASVAAVFADLDIDVSVALVATSGTRAVDVFYVRDEHGAKPSDPKLLQRLRATLIARLTTDYVLPKPQ